MTADDWWMRWCTLWYAIGWREHVRPANYSVEDVLDIVALLLRRLVRLELLEQRTLFGGLFF